MILHFNKPLHIFLILLNKQIIIIIIIYLEMVEFYKNKIQFISYVSYTFSNKLMKQLIQRAQSKYVVNTVNISFYEKNHILFLIVYIN